MAERPPEPGTGLDPSPAALIRSDPNASPHDEEEAPRGSLVLLLLFLAAMAGIWLYVYFLLLDRL